MNDAPILEGRSLKKTYQLGQSRIPVLCGASLQLFEAQWVTILGSSGSGKSTMLHLLGGLDRPDHNGGVVFYRGEPLWSRTNRKINAYRNSEIGFVFQFYHLLPELTVLENTMLPAMIGGSRISTLEARKRAISLLDQLGLQHRHIHRPRELSGGERQRAAIARALVNQPSILFADEPTGNLDEETGNEILDVLSQLHQEGLSIVMVTHNDEIAGRGDLVVHLRHGQIESTATMAQTDLDAAQTSHS
jgi:ABC-type lipoprotein export system ATPase subunit